MRRNDREITDKEQIELFIKSEQILRVGFYDKDEIYIVPVNYGVSFVDGKYIFYFHGATSGRKYELAKKSPKVGFEIDGQYSLMDGEIACDYSAHFQSVIGTGNVFLVENQEEKILALNLLMNQATQKNEWTYSDKMIESVAIFKLVVENLTCKKK